MPCLNNEHVHEWPTTGTLYIERCEKFCGFCTGEKADKPWSYAWFLRRHVRDKHIKSGEYPNLIVADAWEGAQPTRRRKARKSDGVRNEMKIEFASGPSPHPQVAEMQQGESEPPSEPLSELGSDNGTGGDGISGHDSGIDIGTNTALDVVKPWTIVGDGISGHDSGIDIGTNTALDVVTPWTIVGDVTNVTGFGGGYSSNFFPPGLGAPGSFDPFALLPTLVGNEIFSLAVEPQDRDMANEVYSAIQNIGEQAKRASLKPAELLYIIRVYAETVGNEMFGM